MTEENEQKEMHRRRITLNDGRYLIFYTFDEQLGSGPEVEGEGAKRSEPEAAPQAEEERRV
jgi:hypothetical protein